MKNAEFSGYNIAILRTACFDMDGGSIIVSPTSGIALRTVFTSNYRNYNDVTNPAVLEYFYKTSDGSLLYIDNGYDRVSSP